MKGDAMRFNVNIRSGVPVYAQIENQVKFAIASGELKDGDQLPAVQRLAKEVGVNPNTVMKAYRDLEVMGLIFTRRGMGCYVNKGIHARCREECRQGVVKKLHEATQEAKASGMGKKALVGAAGTCFDTDSSPYDEVPAKVLALAKRR